MFKSCAGNITPKQVLGCALSALYGRQIDAVFKKSGLGDMDTCVSRIRIPAFKSDVAWFANEF